eukprot:NODE_413_length_970_cov_890.786102_g276_i1.p1 GENE.NODE_413_length_970_cov_890.786102_g276_i1~~NODE_413_length_970_cov_890.786102_g276_i1.p1  ORF type:complete len:295 (+),score=99.48 NODE_413_length_970_cov_890.786102_g276_i1:29-913(+)
MGEKKGDKGDRDARQKKEPAEHVAHAKQKEPLVVNETPAMKKSRKKEEEQAAAAAKEPAKEEKAAAQSGEPTARQRKDMRSASDKQDRSGAGRGHQQRKQGQGPHGWEGQPTNPVAETPQEAIWGGGDWGEQPEAPQAAAATADAGEKTAEEVAAQKEAEERTLDEHILAQTDERARLTEKLKARTTDRKERAAPEMPAGCVPLERQPAKKEQRTHKAAAERTAEAGGKKKAAPSEFLGFKSAREQARRGKGGGYQDRGYQRQQVPAEEAIDIEDAEAFPSLSRDVAAAAPPPS